MADPIIFTVADPTVKEAKQLNAVWFEWKEEKDDAVSASAGHPVFDSVVLAHIMGPGMQRSEHCKAVARKKPDGTFTKFAGDLDQYLEAFLKGDPGQLAGTPLSELSILDSGLTATLRALGVHSVEALAGMAETAAPHLLGFRKFKTAAQAFLDQRAGQEPLNKLVAENDKLKDLLVQAQTALDSLANRVAELEDAKPGRKKAA